MTAHTEVNWAEATDAEKIQRLFSAVETMASWLVSAQTGFGEQDARGIFAILDGTFGKESS